MPPALEWSILIENGTSIGSPATFTPQLYDQPDQAAKVPPNAPLSANPGDVVTWGNQSRATHQPWPLQTTAGGGLAPMAKNPATGLPNNGTADVPSLFYSQPIGPDGSSTPQYALPATLTKGTVVNYCCLNHPDTERFQIQIV